MAILGYIMTMNFSSQSEIESYVSRSHLKPGVFVNLPALFIGLSYLILLPFHIYHPVSRFYYCS